MKKTLLTSFALVLTATTAVAQVDGMFRYIYDDASQTATITYQRNDDGGMEGGTYYGDVVIPAKAPNGYTVTTIGEYAFYRSNKMTSLTIPATVDSIGRTPFEGCNASLKKIVVEDSEKPLRCFVLDAWPRGCFPVFGRDVQDSDVDFVFKTEAKSNESITLYNRIKGLKIHHSIIKIGTNKPVYLHDKAFWELYGELKKN